ncbi:hypothetical protein CCACVL1_01076, partial [Corchorus capsularis]
GKCSMNPGLSSFHLSGIYV